ncbi:fimbria/pilus outer membrane usher protein [Nissabacter sp. SGAir0207]|uniref:fimbria/pilus outer membrane usher protein n=1 Tax=Nissabacter sp. SGAir0207 TaxID=2126321 RepID=UPI0026BDB652
MPAWRRRPLPLLITLALLGGRAWAADLPPPPTAAAMPNAQLYLEIVVNGRPSGQVLPVEYRDGHYYLSPDQLQQAGVPMLQKGDQPVAIDQIDSRLKVTYSGETQQLLIQVPNDWLPEQRVGDPQAGDYLPAQSSLGLLFNYDIYANQTPDAPEDGYVSAWTEQRLFGNFGALTNSGVYRRDIGAGEGVVAQNRYIRYDTQWQYNDDLTMMSYSAGDVITGALPWTNAVRLGGVQIARNFSTRPDLVTYPLPAFAGQAAVPSTVDLYINNYKTSSAQVNPGPFTLDTVPYVSGAGEATVVTTDALGRQVSTVVPFYVASDLLQAGLTDYSVSLGALRQNYGISSMDYGELAASGTVRHGLTDWLTLEGRAEGARGMAVAGAGTGLRLGRFGVLNSAWSASQSQYNAFDHDDDGAARDNRAEGSFTDSDITDPFAATSAYGLYQAPTGGRGSQTAVGYTYSTSLFSLSAQRILRSENYADLSNYQTRYRLSRRSDQLTGSLSLGRFGTLGSGYFDVRDADGGRTRLVNLSYSKSLGRNISFYATANREIGGNGFNAQLMISIPFGDMGTASFGATRDTENRWNGRATYSRAIPTDGGFGWNLAYADGQTSDSQYRQADLSWRGDHTEVRGGLYGSRSNYTRWGQLSGSLVAMDGRVYAANQVNDAFALVSTDGYSGIPVSYENQKIGETDDRGYLLVPTVTSFYHARFQIDPLDLPADVSTPTVERTLSIRRNSGLLVNFPVKQLSAANLTLVGPDGKPLPNGSTVRVEGRPSPIYVGWDGLVWLEEAKQENRLTITRMDDGSVCHVTVRLPQPKGLHTLGPLVCRP